MIFRYYYKDNAIVAVVDGNLNMMSIPQDSYDGYVDSEQELPINEYQVVNNQLVAKEN